MILQALFQIFFLSLPIFSQLDFLQELPENTFLFFNLTSSITPFSILEIQELSGLLFTLQYTCPQSLSTSVLFQAPHQDFCLHTNFTGDIYQLSNLLQTLKAKPITNTTQVIKFDYLLFYQENSTTGLQLVFNSSINYQIFNYIPFNQTLYQLDVSSGDHKFSDIYTIGQIDQAYLNKAVDSDPRIFVDQDLEWIQGELESTYIQLRIGKINETNFPKQIQLYLKDLTYGLQTPVINLRANLTGEVGGEQIDKIYFFLFVLIFTVIITCFILLLYYANRQADKRQEANENEETSQEKQQQQEGQQKQQISQNSEAQLIRKDKETCLSDSIINWNKKLAENQNKKEQVQNQNDFDTNPYQQMEEPKEEKKGREFGDISDIEGQGKNIQSENKKTDEEFKF